MGSAASKSARRYPTASARGGVDQLLKATTPQPIPKLERPPKPVISQDPEPLESVIMAAKVGEKKQHTAGTKAVTADDLPPPPPRATRVNDPALGLEDFEAPGGNYNSQLNNMLKRLGPVDLGGSVTQLNNFRTNPVAQMFKVRDEVARQGKKQEEDVTSKRTLFSSGEIADIIDSAKQGWSEQRIEEHYNIEKGVLAKLGTAFSKFEPAQKNEPLHNEQTGNDFDQLVSHGEEYMDTALNDLEKKKAEAAEKNQTAPNDSFVDFVNRIIDQPGTPKVRASIKYERVKPAENDDDDYDKLMSHGEESFLFNDAKQAETPKPTEADGATKPADTRAPPEYIKRYFEQEQGSGKASV
ncbi:hypothetical protein BZA70DRAFT_266063 [Myxozyma melibiosi]|uniref:Uncharacterized protein n=1 Tax=Myxozyma melibiosi TaxID=54550 RepID=A0ABR1F9W3_9ASCO